MTYKITWETEGVVVKFTRVYDDKVNNSATIDLYSSPKLAGIKYCIWDLSEVTEMRLSKNFSTVIATVDQIASRKLPNIKLAMLACTSETRFFCNCYKGSYQARLTGWDFLIADNIQEINQWVRRTPHLKK